MNSVAVGMTLPVFEKGLGRPWGIIPDTSEVLLTECPIFYVRPLIAILVYVFNDVHCLRLLFVDAWPCQVRGQRRVRAGEISIRGRVGRKEANGI